MFRLLLVFFLVFPVLKAADDYSVRLAGGWASASDFDELYTFKGANPSPYGTTVFGAEGGYRLLEDMFDWPFDLYAKGGLNYFNEKGYQDDVYEATLYLKLYWKLNFLENQVRVGLAEGLSYASDALWVEKQEAAEKKDNVSYLLNYMELTFDFDVGKLVRVPSLEGLYLGYLIKHRSGMYGLYGNVRDGGSNYNCVYLEKNF
jgi:outer membrane protein